MAKEQENQTQENQDQDAKSAEEIADAAEEQAATEKATKTSEAFDERIDSEGVEETPPEDDEDTAKTEKAEAKSEESDSAEAEEKQEKAEAEDETKDDDQQKVESKVSEQVAKRAIDLGMTEEEIVQFSDDADLERTLNIIDGIIDDTEADDTKAQTTAPAKTEPKKEAEEEDSGFKLEFKNEADIDPELLAGMKGMEKLIVDQQKENKDLRNQVKGLVDNFQAQDERRAMAQFDKMVVDLGPEFEDTFGKGPSSELSRRGAASKNRLAVRQHMYAYAKGLNEAGLTIPEPQDLFNRTVHNLYERKSKTVESLRVQQKGDARTKGARLGRPATRRAGNLTPDQKALETQKKFDDMIDASDDA